MDVREFNSELLGLRDWYCKRMVYFNKLAKLLKAVAGKEKLSSLWTSSFFDQLRKTDNLEEQKFAWCVFYHVVPNLVFTADSLKSYKSKAAEAVARLENDLQRAKKLAVAEGKQDVLHSLNKTAAGLQKYIEICNSEADKAFRSGGRRNGPSVLELQQFGKRSAAAFQVEVSVLPVPPSSGNAHQADTQDGVLVDCKMNTTVQECVALVAKQLGVTNPSCFTLFVSSLKGAALTNSPAWYALHPCLFMADVVAEQSRYLGLPPPASPDQPPPALGITFLFKAFVVPANPKGTTSATVAALLHRQSLADSSSGLALPGAPSRCECLPFRVDIASVMDASHPVDSVPPGSSGILAISTRGLQLVTEAGGELLYCSPQEVASLDVSRNKVTLNTSRCQVLLECHPKHAQGMWTTWQAVLKQIGQIEELRAFGVAPSSAAKQRSIKVNSKDATSPSPPDTPPPGFQRTASIPTPISACSTPSTPITRSASCNSNSSMRSNPQRVSITRWDPQSQEATSASPDTALYNPRYRYGRTELLAFKSSCTSMPFLMDEGPYLKSFVESPTPAPTSPWSPTRGNPGSRKSVSISSSGRFSPSFPSSPLAAPGLSPTNSSCLTRADSGGMGSGAFAQEPPPHMQAPPHAVQHL